MWQGPRHLAPEASKWGWSHAPSPAWPGSTPPTVHHGQIRTAQEAWWKGPRLQSWSARVRSGCPCHAHHRCLLDIHGALIHATRRKLVRHAVSPFHPYLLSLPAGGRQDSSTLCSQRTLEPPALTIASERGSRKGKDAGVSPPTRPKEGGF